MDSRCLIALIAVIALVAPAIGISQGEAVYLGQYVDISGVTGWSSEIAWNGGYAPPSAGSSPVVIKLPGSQIGLGNYYIDPAVFGKYPGRWYKWNGGGFTAPKENTIVFNIGNLPEEPPANVATAIPTVTVGPTPRIETTTTTQPTQPQDPIFAQIGILIGIGLIAIFVLYAVITHIEPPLKPIDPVVVPQTTTGVKVVYVETPVEVVKEKVIYVPMEPEPEPEPVKLPRKDFTPKTKALAKARAEGKCEYEGCQERTELDVHHKHGNHDNSLDNAIVLCVKHHRAIHTFERMMQK